MPRVGNVHGHVIKQVATVNVATDRIAPPHTDCSITFARWRPYVSQQPTDGIRYYSRVFFFLDFVHTTYEQFINAGRARMTA